MLTRQLKRVIAFAAASLLLPISVRAQVPLPQKLVMATTNLSLNHDVTVSVQEINAISVSGNVVLNIAGATAGSSPNPDTDAASTYNVTVNAANRKLTGALDVVFSSGISLDLLLAAPLGGTAAVRTLDATTQDLVTGFGNVAETGLAISYTASATTLAAPNGAGETRTVTLTLTAN